MKVTDLGLKNFSKEGMAFGAIAALMFIHLIVRAFEVPITYEEALRFFTMVEPSGMAQDHLLTVGWSKLTNALMGPSLFAQRLLSLLAYVLFARYAYLLGSLLRPGLVRWCVWLSLLIMPFAVELFALAGGQALAMAFMLMGLWHVGQISLATSMRHPFLAILAFLALAFSTMAMLPAWAIGMAVLFVVLLGAPSSIRWKALLLWAVVGIAPGVMLFMGYHTDASAQQWQVMDEVRLAMVLVFGSKAPWLVWSLVLAVAGMAWVAFGMRRDPEHLVQRVLLRTDLLLLFWPLLYLALLELTDPLHDLLPWLPLFLLGFGLLVDAASRQAAHRRWLALLLLLPGVIMLQSIHVGTTRSSGDGAIPKTLNAKVKELQEKADHGLVIGGGMRQEPGWEFARLFDVVPLSSLQTDRFALESADVLLVSRQEADDVSGTYREIGNGPGGLTLLERKEPFAYTLLVDTALTFPSGDAEFMELPLPPLEELLGKAINMDLVAEFKAPSTGGDGPYLVIEINDADMGHIYYASRFLPTRNGGTIPAKRLSHALPTIPADAQRVAIYIWNPARVSLSLEKAHLQILQRNQHERLPTE